MTSGNALGRLVESRVQPRLATVWRTDLVSGRVTPRQRPRAGSGHPPAHGRRHVVCLSMSTYEQHDHEAGKRASGLVMAGFGTLWWLAGAGPVGGVPGSAALALGVVIGLTLAVNAARRLSAHGEQERFERNARQFAMINVIQALGIAATIVVADRIGATAWIPAVIAIAVGVHFLPLARLFAAPEYRWTGALMIGVGVVGAALALAGVAASVVLTVVGLSTAVTLWASVVWVVRHQQLRSVRHRPEPPRTEGMS